MTKKSLQHTASPQCMAESSSLFLAFLGWQHPRVLVLTASPGSWGRTNGALRSPTPLPSHPCVAVFIKSSFINSSCKLLLLTWQCAAMAQVSTSRAAGQAPVRMQQQTNSGKMRAMAPQREHKAPCAAR